MPYQIGWLTDKHIILIRTWGVSTIDEYEALVHKTQQLAAQSDRPLVHSITDVSGLVKHVAVKEVMKVATKYSSPENTGWILIVGAKNKMFKFTISVGVQMLGDRLRLRLFDTMQEAIDLLKDVDSTIDWENADYGILSDIHLTDSL